MYKVFFIAALLFANLVFAGETKLPRYKCGYSTIKYNMTEEAVTKACGKTYLPKHIEYIGVVYYSAKNQKNLRHVYYSRWQFKRKGRFRHYIYFSDGKVSLITQNTSIRD